jgi:xylulokinase
MTLLGIDIGTTGCKAILFGVDGTLLAKASREYPVDIPHPQWAEQDLENVWRLVQQAIREVIASAHIADIAAVGLSVHGEAVTPVDAHGRAMRPTILGMDTRTAPQNDWLRETFGNETLFQRTGMPIHTVNTLPKLLWLKHNEPEVWKKAARFLLVEDFIIQKMTGLAVTSQCLASRTQMFNLHQRQWDAEILAVLNLEPERLAEVRPSGYPVAKMHPSLAQALGFSKPPLVVTGGHDQACGALGVGLTRAGLAMVSTGTAEVVEVAIDQPVVSPALFRGNISIYAHVIPGLYVTMTLNHSGGLLLRWFRDTFGQAEMAEAARTGRDAYDLLLSGASPEPTGLLVLPHFAGSGTPTFDTQSKGAILGLTFATTRSQLARAMLEGLTYELHLNLQVLAEGGIAIEQLRAIGGGATSPFWLQLKADMTGIPVAAPVITEAAAWGAALLAGQAAGLFPSAASHAEEALKIDRVYQPDPSRHARYATLYQQYRQVYPALAPILHNL